MTIRYYTKKKDQLAYFQILDDSENAILGSTGYEDKEKRKTDAEWTLANLSDEDYYLVKEEGTKVRVTVQDKGQNKVAQSSLYDSLRDLKKDFPFVNDASTDEGTPYQGKQGDDDYEQLDFYQENITGVQNGFDTFENDKGSFFTYNIDSKIILISESYTSARGRDNGVNSVTKNLPIDERYQRQVHPNGKNYFNLLAGNRQEIATSIWFDSAGDMESAINKLSGKGVVTGTAAAAATNLIAADRVANLEIPDPIPATPTEPKPKKKRKKRSGPAKPKAEKVYLADGTYLFNDLTYQIFRSGNGRH